MLIERCSLYGPGGQHQIIRPESSPFIVIDGCGFNWREVEQWRGEGVCVDGLYSSLDLHLDADDPSHEFLSAEDWEPIPGGARLAKAYNLPFTKSMRLRVRRSTDCMSVLQVMNPHYRAAMLLELARKIRQSPSEHVVVGDFDWSPSGVIWENGEKRYSGVAHQTCRQ